MAMGCAAPSSLGSMLPRAAEQRKTTRKKKWKNNPKSVFDPEICSSSLPSSPGFVEVSLTASLVPAGQPQGLNPPKSFVHLQNREQKELLPLEHAQNLKPRAMWRRWL